MADVLSGQVFPFDPTGKLASNKITNEFHVLTAANHRNYHFIVPKKGPYFEDSLVITLRNTSGVVVPLVKGKDWVPSHWFIGASRACAKNIYGSVTFINASLVGNVELAYQTIGGQWVLDTKAIEEILADALNNPITTSWEVVAKVPETFPPVPHEWDLVDMVGQTEVQGAILQVVNAVASKNGSSGTGGTGGTGSTAITKASIGLGNVANYGPASVGTIDNNTGDNTVVTPAGVRRLITVMVLDAFNEFKDRRDNPNQVTASQVGTYSAKELDVKLVTKLDDTAVAFDSYRFGGMDYQQVKADILSGTANNSAMLGGRTVNQIVQDIQLAASSGDTFGGMSVAEFITYLNGGDVALNADTLNGMTLSRLSTEILQGTANNAMHLNGRTLEDILQQVSGGIGGDAKTLDGLTLQEVISRALTEVQGSSTAYGLTKDDLIAEILTGKAADSNKINGYDWSTVVNTIIAMKVADSTLFDGRDHSTIMQEVADSTVANALQLEGKDLAGVTEEILKGKAADSALFDGKTPIEFTNEVLSNVTQFQQASLNSAFGMSENELTAKILAGTAANALKVGGRTVESILTELRTGSNDRIVSTIDATGNTADLDLALANEFIVTLHPGPATLNIIGRDEQITSSTQHCGIYISTDSTGNTTLTLKNNSSAPSGHEISTIELERENHYYVDINGKVLNATKRFELISVEVRKMIKLNPL